MHDTARHRTSAPNRSITCHGNNISLAYRKTRSTQEFKHSLNHGEASEIQFHDITWHGLRHHGITRQWPTPPLYLYSQQGHKSLPRLDTEGIGSSLSIQQVPGVAARHAARNLFFSTQHGTGHHPQITALHVTVTRFHGFTGRQPAPYISSTR